MHTETLYMKAYHAGREAGELREEAMHTAATFIRGTTLDQDDVERTIRHMNAAWQMLP